MSKFFGTPQPSLFYEGWEPPVLQVDDNQPNSNKAVPTWKSVLFDSQKSWKSVHPDPDNLENSVSEYAAENRLSHQLLTTPKNSPIIRKDSESASFNTIGL